MTLRDLLFLLSSFSIGGALFSAALCVRMVKAHPHRYISFILARLGYGLTVGTVLWYLILPASGLPLTTATYWYIAGLVLGAMGFMGTGKVIRQEYIDWEIEQEAKAKEEVLNHEHETE